MLYLYYFPLHLKYQRTLPLSGSPRPGYGALADGDNAATGNDRDDSSVVEERVDGTRRPVKVTITTTPEWRLAVAMGVVVFLHV